MIHVVIWHKKKLPENQTFPDLQKLLTKYPLYFWLTNEADKINPLIPTWKFGAQHTAAVQSESTGKAEQGVALVKLGAQHLRCNL